MKIFRLLRSFSQSLPRVSEESLVKSLHNDMKNAMKAKDKIKSQVLKSVLSDINYSIKNNQNISSIQVLLKSIKKRSDAILQYKNASREDLSRCEELEISILEKYLPERISDQQLKILIHTAIKENPKLDFGKLMKKFTLEYDASQVPRDILAKLLKTELKDLN